jgi:hypothetical protein
MVLFFRMRGSRPLYPSSSAQGTALCLRVQVLIGWYGNGDKSWPLNSRARGNLKHTYSTYLRYLMEHHMYEGGGGLVVSHQPEFLEGSP